MAEIQTNGRSYESLLEKVLSMNIVSSDYFKELYGLKTYHEVIDEIYNQVSHVEPWMGGNCRGPSTAYCLLYKFFTMKLTVKQMHGLLKHTDSPYIRAVGFLYLRYVADAKTLWTWYEPYIKDDEEFAPGSNGRTTTMGVYVRDLLLGLYYFDTLFPRIPVPVMRQIVSNLEKMNLPTKPSGSTGDMSRGSEDTARRPPSVKASLSVSFGQRAPHRASTRGSSPVRRPPPSGYDRNERDEPQRRSPRRSQSRDYYSDRDSDRQKERDRERERDRYRERERDYGNDRRSRRDYESRSRRSDYEDDRSRRDHRRSRSRSRSRSVQIEREPTPQRDYGNKEKAATTVNSNLAKLKDLYGDASNQKGGDEGYGTRRDSNSEEVIKLGGSSWR
ncbi:hypothetical protein Bca4012_083667 [Brassica carinata]